MIFLKNEKVVILKPKQLTRKTKIFSILFYNNKTKVLTISNLV